MLVSDPTGFPLPVAGRDVIVAAAPGQGPGFWAGAPSAALAPDGKLVVAYRVRSPDRRGTSVAIGRLDGAHHLETVATLGKELFGAESLERPALVAVEGGWRLYVSCATPGSKHWRIDVVEAAALTALGAARPRTVLAGDVRTGVKDPVIRRRGALWQAWVCCHPLDRPGEEDRMSTALCTSADGLDWRWHGTVLSGRRGKWDARGARVTSVLPGGRASYDGRAGKEENFSERTGVALPSGGGGRLRAGADAPVADLRYLDVLPMPAGGHVLFFERPREDGAHDLCMQRVPPAR